MTTPTEALEEHLDVATVRRIRGLAGGISVLVVLAAVLVLAGYAFGLPVLTVLQFGLQAMSVITAACLVLLALALAAELSRRPRLARPAVRPSATRRCWRSPRPRGPGSGERSGRWKPSCAAARNARRRTRAYPSRPTRHPPGLQPRRGRQTCSYQVSWVMTYEIRRTIAASQSRGQTPGLQDCIVPPVWSGSGLDSYKQTVRFGRLSSRHFSDVLIPTPAGFANATHLACRVDKVARDDLVGICVHLETVGASHLHSADLIEQRFPAHDRAPLLITKDTSLPHWAKFSSTNCLYRLRYGIDRATRQIQRCVDPVQ